MSFSTGEQAAEALAALGRKLDENATDNVALFICGGAALNISGLLTRLTADVDVLGDLNAEGDLGEMPDWIFSMAEVWTHVGSTTLPLRWRRSDFRREFYHALAGEDSVNGWRLPSPHASTSSH